jgi:23S rRNA (cytidine1920-2'-O)/16S rRNA (cytidine1409-2'-O)-methyltransferase
VAKKPANRKKPSPLSNLPEKSRYVSRGGDKLRGALDAFGITVNGKICLDVGSSTGGFTDCLLQAGAARVIAIDVGYGLLDYKLRNDPRIQLLERTNFRFLDPAQLSSTPDLITVDVSFISLDKIFPKIGAILSPQGEAVILVKPQFEGTPKEVPGGFVKDEAVRQQILFRVEAATDKAGYTIAGKIDSPVKGRKGNQETFLWLKKS